MSPSRAGVRVVGSGEGPGEPDRTPGEHDLGSPELATSRPPGGEAGPVERRRGRRLGPAARRAPIVAVAVGLIGGLFGTGFFWLKVRSLADANADQKAVTAVSQDVLVALTNFSANTIDADFNRVQSYATGDFQSQALQFFSTDARRALAKVQAVSRGQINALYVQSVHDGLATTFADIDQTIANINFSSPEQDELRIVLTLKKLAVGWRVSEVTVEQGPAVPTPAVPTPAVPTPAVPTPGIPVSP